MAKRKSRAATTGQKKPRSSVQGRAKPQESSPAEPSPPTAQTHDLKQAAGRAGQEKRLDENLVKTVIALPLLDKLNDETKQRMEDPSQPPLIYQVIIDLNLDYPKGRDAARDWVFAEIERLISQGGENRGGQQVDKKKSAFNRQWSPPAATSRACSCASPSTPAT